MGSDTTEKVVNPALELLEWVYQRSRQGCFSRKRSERDKALSEINQRVGKFVRPALP